MIACCSQQVSDDLPNDQISILFSYSSQYNACYLLQMIYSKMPVMATVKCWKMIALLCRFISGHGSGCLPALQLDVLYAQALLMFHLQEEIFAWSWAMLNIFAPSEKDHWLCFKSFQRFLWRFMALFQTMQGSKWNREFNILKLIVKSIYLIIS